VIFDHITKASLYSFPNAHLKRGLDFLQRKDLAALPVGRTELDGDRLFALVQEYSTRSEADCFWEVHRKYIDIQFIAAGTEEIGYAPMDELKILQSYDTTKDMMKLAGEGISLTLKAGSFAIFFPHDAHKPCMASMGKSEPVRKIVVKVAVGE
jgi:biofilm protein TabA